MLSTPFTDLVGCERPLQSAGMATSSPALAGAVARAGALGTGSGTLLSPSGVELVLDEIGEPGPGAIAVNFIVPFLEDMEVVDVAARRARVVEFFYGDPDRALVDRVHAGGALAAWQVGSTAEAVAAERAGCDLVVVQGVEAGGHVRGSLGLLPLLGEVLDVLGCPVVAAGGISTPRAMAAALAAGAAAVRLGTSVVAAVESGFHPRYRQALVEARGEDAVYTDRFSVMWPGAPHRVLRSSLEAAEAFDGEIVGEMLLGDELQPVPRFSVPSPTESASGTIEAMPHYAGQGVGAVREVRPAATIVRELAAAAESLLRSPTWRLSGQELTCNMPSAEAQAPATRSDMPRVAAVQMQAIPMDVDASLDAIDRFASQAAANGAELVVFPELVVPGYPRYVPDPFPSTDEGRELWADIQRYHRAYVQSSQEIPGPFTDALGAIASRVRADLLVGVSERHPAVRSRLWNTAAMVARDGTYLGKHRKLVGVMHERIFFERGGREDLLVFETDAGRIAACICFENHNPLIRRALGQLGAEIHCALWTGPVPLERAREGGRLERHRELGIAQALDTGTWVVISSQVTPREPPGGEFGSRWAHSGGSYIIDPLGETVAAVPDFEEGIAVADVDLGLIDTGRLIWNQLGEDGRDDIFADGAADGNPSLGLEWNGEPAGGEPLAAPETGA